MKKTLFIFTFTFFFIFTSFSQVFYGEEARKAVPGSELVKPGFNTSIPQYIRFGDRAGIKFDNPPYQDEEGSVGDLAGGGSPFRELEGAGIEKWLNRTFKIEDGSRLKFLKYEKDNLGFTHYKYQQTLNDIPIEGAIYMVHVKNRKVKSMNGILFNALNLNSIPKLSENQALNKALQYINAAIGGKGDGKVPPSGGFRGAATVYKWEIPGEEEHLKLVTNDPNATYYPDGKLVFVPKNGNNKSTDYRLAYKFDIYASEPLYRAYIFVDAVTGEVIFENNRIRTNDVPGTAVTKYSGTKTIITDSTGSGYRLREAGRGNGIQTWDMNTGTNYGNAVDFTDADNFWNNVNADQDEVATDAHWGAEMTYDYLWNDHGRNSIDGSGFMLRSYVHYNNNYSNAFWDGQRMTYGDGSGSYSPFTALDIAGHEIGHGLTDFTADLVYSYESGALNESFSDILGTSVEFYGKPAQANWLVGEDIGVVLRSMADPKVYGDPDTYLGVNWATGPGDNGGVHTNSGVQNFWYYLLANGGSGTNDNGDSYNITGIGLANAGAIAFRNLTVYLWPNAQYDDARFYAIQSAIDIFGPCTPEVIATTDAWYAVGVGGIFNPTVISDFSANPASSCSFPFTANFTNLSSNGGSFYWDFGDGDTNSAVNPAHIYNSYGTFTVSLVADGGACGIDTTVKTAYIVVDSTLPCIVNMPLSGEGDLQTSCTGTLYDNGGPAGTYADNTTNYITIAPLGAATVTLNIISFDIEPGSGGPDPCDYDYVEFFDGPNTTYPSFGKFCNTTGSPVTITSTGGSITILHFADPLVNGDGFEINWNCTYPSTPPVAGFTSDVTSTCTGVINFMDLSSNGAASWLWYFGDGDTSTQQNPVHTYVNNGTYTVKLVVTNGFGADSLIQASYITVSKPAAPAAIPAARCGQGSVALSASGAGLINWYDDSLTTNLVNTGSTYNTPPLSATTDYWVEEVVLSASQYVGPPDNTFGSGANFQGDRHLVFDCYKSLRIVSVLVYAQGAGFRTIELRDNIGLVIRDTLIYIQDGESRITLNFDVPVGTDLQLGISGTPDLFRNSTGANYPYILPGWLSITGVNAPTSYYYFFYDWEVKEPCTSENTRVTATIYQEPTAAVTGVTNTTCIGACDGVATATASGGSPPYSWFWSPSNQVDSTAIICSGLHSVVVTDTNGCTDTTSLTITEPPPIVLALSSVDANCGNADGEVFVIASGGAAPYTFLWDDSSAQVNDTATGLAAGTYSVIVTDTNGCTDTGAVFVSNTVPIVSITSWLDVSCNGYSDGEATASASGGTLPYAYQWDDPLLQTTDTAVGLLAGAYTITVTDSNNCVATAVITINEPPAITLSISVINANCGQNDGEATVFASGGDSSYTYQWDDSLSQTTATAMGLSAGTYTITVTDSTGCTRTDTAAIISLPAGTAMITSSSDVSCSGMCDGSATASMTGSAPPFTYLWDDDSAQTNATAAGLCAGIYNVVVTDSNGCADIANITINESSATLIISSNNATCDSANGMAVVSVSGGVFPYSYLWDDPLAQTTDTATGLTAGGYSVIITDAIGCIDTGTVTVGDAGPPAVSIVSITNITCNGSSDGTAAVSVDSGGVPPFSFIWDNGDTTAAADSLAAGIHIVIVTDSNGCIASADTNIDQPAPIIAAVTSSLSPSCIGACNGLATVSAAGGTPPYTYQWDDPLLQTTATADSLCAGTYIVSVSDANGCSPGIDTVTIVEPDSISVTIIPINISCNGVCDGDVTVTVSGGTPPYMYVWDIVPWPGPGLCAGTYHLTLTDVNGCVVMDSVTIYEPPALTSVITNSANPTCAGVCDGAATVTPSGGTGTYTYLWQPNGSTDSTATGLCAGTNTVTVTDANGCVVIDSVTLSEPPPLILISSVTNASCNGLCDGSIMLNVFGGTAPYTFSCSWANCNFNNLCAANYIVTVIDSQGCTISDSIIITEPDSIFITSIVDTPTLGNNGAINLTVTGGTPPYAFLWDNGATTEDIDSLVAGAYQVVVTDSLDCIDSLTIQVPQATDITETNLAGGVKIYPNPFTTETTLILTSLNKYKSGVVLSLYDIVGSKRSISYTVNHKINDVAEIRLKRGDLPAGIYFYSVRAGENLISNGKLIVQ